MRPSSGTNAAPPFNQPMGVSFWIHQKEETALKATVLKNRIKELDLLIQEKNLLVTRLTDARNECIKSLVSLEPWNRPEYQNEKQNIR